MGTTETASSWGKIRLGVRNAERPLEQRQYNLAIIKCRQTLEIMVRSLAGRVYMVDADLSVTVDNLYQGKWISRTICDHYHKIHMIGNKTVHEGNDNTYDADQAFHLLSQEIYTFSNDYKASRPKTRRPTTSSGAGASRSRRGSRRNKKGFSFSQAGILRIPIGVLCIIFTIVLVNFLRPGKKKDTGATTPVTTEETSPESTPPETMAETASAPVYKTSTMLNVHAGLSTTATVRGRLQPDAIASYMGQRDDEWSIIAYGEQQSYVATQYLVHDQGFQNTFQLPRALYPVYSALFQSQSIDIPQKFYIFYVFYIFHWKLF